MVQFYNVPLKANRKYFTYINGVNNIVSISSDTTIKTRCGTDNVLDLTLMFGSGNEPTTVNELKALLPNDYYAYNAGTIVNNNNTWTTGVWNQLVQNGNFENDSGWTAAGGGTFSIANNIATVTANSTSSIAFSIAIPIITGHKYYCRADVKNSSSATIVYLHGGSAFNNAPSTSSTEKTTLSFIGTSLETSTTERRPQIYITSQSSGDTVEVSNFMVIDLTDIYSSGNEPSSTSTVISDMAKWGYDLTTYQAYNAGTAVGGSVDLSSLNLRSAGSVKDEFDCIAESNNLIRRVGMINLSSLTDWNRETIGTNSIRYAANLSTAKQLTTNAMTNLNNITFVSSGINEDVAGRAEFTNNMIYLRVDTSISTLELFNNYISGKQLVYELASSTTSTVTAQSISLKTGVNSLYEKSLSTTNFYNTDASLTYKGTNYNISLISGHKYLFRDNGTDSILTPSSATAQAVVGGEDILIDMTKEFGSGNVPTTAEALYNYYPLYRNTIDYNAGQLVNYVGTGIRTNGFNQWDEEWELGYYNITTGEKVTSSTQIRSKNYIQVLPNTTYYFKAVNTMWVLFYDANKNYLSSYDSASDSAKTMPANCYYITFYMVQGYGTTYNNDITINIVDSNNTAANGTYEAYWERTLNFPTITAIQKHATTVYVRSGSTAFTANWLSLTDGGAALTPAANTAYKVATQGTYYGKVYFWNTSTSVYDEDEDNSRNLLFPDGLCSAGSVHDEITNSYAIKRVGKYIITGNESSWDWGGWMNNAVAFKVSITDAALASSYDTTSSCALPLFSGMRQTLSSGNSHFYYLDGTTMSGMTLDTFKAAMVGTAVYYTLANPIKVTFDNDSTTGSANITANLDLSYRVAKQGLEQSLPVATTIVPTCSPFYGSVSYGADYVATIDGLPTNYISKASFDTFATNMSNLGITVTPTWSTDHYEISASVKDYSSSITSNTGMSIVIKKASKIGNVVFLTLTAANLTGSTISAGTTLFTLGSGLYNSSGDIQFAISGGYTVTITTGGILRTNSSIANYDAIYITTSYAV